uniref:Uncharacterized protein n=1 Tax=Strongyloides venezuelensis TaxID=75913 RepID=A0A0K0FH26_STRVS
MFPSRDNLNKVIQLKELFVKFLDDWDNLIYSKQSSPFHHSQNFNLIIFRVKLLLIIVSTEVLESILKIIIYYRRSSFEKKCIPIVKKRKFCKNSITIVYKKIVWKNLFLIYIRKLLDKFIF